MAPAKNPGRCPAGTCLRRRCAPKEDDVYKPTHAAQPDRRPLWEALILAALLPDSGRKPGDPAAIPFGPAIAAGTWLCLLGGGPLVSWYLGLFGLS